MNASLPRRLILAGGAAAALGIVADRMLGHPLFRLLRRRSQDAGAAERVVAVATCESYGTTPLRLALLQGMTLAPPPDVRGKRVVLKPNFVEYHGDAPITTRVELIREVVRSFRDLGAGDVTVGEGPGHHPDTDEVWGRSGLARAAAEDGFRLVDLNYDDVAPLTMRTVPTGGSLGPSRIPKLFLPQTILAADLLVSMPKMKTHHWAGCTLGMKNLFGIVPGAKYGWPKNVLHWNGIARSIVELAANVPVGYTIVDGIEGMEGDGPIRGTAVASRLLVFGRSVFDVDRTAAFLMGIDGQRLDWYRVAAEWGLFPPGEIRVVGGTAASLRRDYRLLDRFESLRA